ncbi:uncharacterized protein NPIL_333081 [Nephila pilipes]|uniref:CCHC-type domain-containing protein n=1 Tax=Nephila pilipes TaxID=299642 RepID=A0A8X6NK09_NEPPI|nr:uncharacterized protein NPIL_333081 [Nephila pilipes]
MNKSQDKKYYGCKSFGHVQANCPKNSRNSTTKPDSQYSTTDRTVKSLSIQTFSKHPMHFDIQLAVIQLTAFCDNGSQAALINEKTHGRILVLHNCIPSELRFGQDTIKSIGYFRDSIEI